MKTIHGKPIYPDVASPERESVSEPSVESFEKKILRLQRRIAELESRLTAIQALVDEQAEDDGLWFVAEYASEGYLQQELRRLHRLIEEGK